MTTPEKRLALFTAVHHAQIVRDRVYARPDTVDLQDRARSLSCDVEELALAAPDDVWGAYVRAAQADVDLRDHEQSLMGLAAENVRTALDEALPDWRWL